MPLVSAGPLSRLEPGTVIEVEAGGELYAVCNVEGRVYAVSGACPHSGGPLGHGALNGHHIACPWHMWEFDCRTGEYDRDPAVRLKTIPVRIEAGEILLETP